MKRPFGDFVSELRMSKKKTLRQIAPEIGISMVYFSEIESGKKIPTAEYMKKIADYFNVPMDKLERLAMQQRFFCGEETNDKRIEVARSIIGLSEKDFKDVQKLIDSKIKRR